MLPLQAVVLVELTESTGRPESGEPPGIWVRLTCTQPVPSVFLALVDETVFALLPNEDVETPVLFDIELKNALVVSADPPRQLCAVSNMGFVTVVRYKLSELERLCRSEMREVSRARRSSSAGLRTNTAAPA